MGKSGGAPRTRTWLVCGALTAVAAGTLGVVAAPAEAAVFTSKTTLATVMSADGASLTMTATVANTSLPNGPGISPSGTVTFTDSAGDRLGALTAPNCGMTACAVKRTVTVSQLADNVSSLTASYSGDSTLGAGSASTPIAFRRCAAKAGCFNALTSGVTSIGVGTPVGDTALVTVGGTKLPCSVGAGAVVNAAVSGPGTKTIGIQIQHSGTAATTYMALDAKTKVAQAHTNYRCDVSTNPYQGFSAGSTTFTKSLSDFTHYGTVPQLAAGAYKGQYVGLLPDCTYWFAHSWPTYPAVCNSVPTSPSTTSDVVYLGLYPTSGVSHLAG